MRDIKIFILGILSILLLIPIIESISEIICTFLEYPKGLASKKVLKLNKELLKLQSETEEIDTVAIGFQCDAVEYDEDDCE